MSGGMSLLAALVAGLSTDGLTGEKVGRGLLGWFEGRYFRVISTYSNGLFDFLSYKIRFVLYLFLSFSKE